jgi:anaerobic selenocysteine-containing dehydrogenase
MATPRRPRAESELVYRTCPLCEAKCGIAVEVDRAAGEVVTIRGDTEDPFSRGYLCPKAYGLKGLQEDPDRLRRPVRRRGSAWEEIGWDDAFDLAASRLREVRDGFGADAIGTYIGNPNAHDLGSLLYMPALLRGLGTRRRFSASSVETWTAATSCSCSGPTRSPRTAA